MTTLNYLRDFEMDVSRLDDKMELGTSPHPQLDDIDFDLDPMRDPSVDRSMADDAEAAEPGTETMQAEPENVYNDDDMLDDENLQADNENEIADLSMEAYNQTEDYNQDDEILYDEEESGYPNTLEVQDVANVDQTIVETDDAFQPTEELEIEPTIVEETEEQNNTVPYANTSAEHSGVDSDEIQIQQETDAADTVDQEHNHDVAAETEVVDFAHHQHTDQPDIDPEQQSETDVLDPQLRQTEESSQFDVRTSEAKEQEISHDITQNTEFGTENTLDGEANVNEETLVRKRDVGTNLTESLHPVTVVYMDQEMSLFPPMVDDSSATFFLSDSTLAYEPIDKLLASCREILGDSLEHDDELVLDISSLGLHICEDSKYAPQITLSQVVEVYLSLSRNEGIDEIEPLVCSLNSRVCLASQYAYLAASASEGKTYSEIAADYVNSPEHDAVSYQGDPSENQSEDVGTLASKNHDSVYDRNTLPPSHVTDDDVSGSVSGFDGVVQLDAIETKNGQMESASPKADVEPEMKVVEERVTIVPEPNIDESAPQEEDTGNQNRNVTIETELGTTHVETAKEEEDNEDDDGGLRDKLDTELRDDEEIAQEEAVSPSSHTVQEDTTDGAEGQPDEDLSLDYEERNPAPVQYPADETHEQPDLYGLEDELFPGENIDAEVGINDQVELPDSAAIPNLLTDIDNGAETGPVETTEEETENGETNFRRKRDTNDELDWPETPSKQNGGKRKALNDEEDLDFLDLSTPEPKRTRAS